MLKLKYNAIQLLQFLAHISVHFRNILADIGLYDFQKWEYFKEPMHLNDEGARTFTNVIMHRLMRKAG